MPDLFRSRLALVAGALLVAIASQHPAAAQDQRGVLRDACKADYQRLCSGVQPGGGRILKCLQDQADRLSPACHAALAQRNK